MITVLHLIIMNYWNPTVESREKRCSIHCHYIVSGGAFIALSVNSKIKIKELDLGEGVGAGRALDEIYDWKIYSQL